MNEVSPSKEHTSTCCTLPYMHVDVRDPSFVRLLEDVTES